MKSLLFLLILTINLNEFLCDLVSTKNEEALNREKRVAVSQFSNSAVGENGKKTLFPIIMPPYDNPNGAPQLGKNENWGSCLMYLEGVTIVVIDTSKKNSGQSAVLGHIDGSNSTTKWVWDKDNSLFCKIVKISESDAENNKTQYFWFDVSITLDKDIPAYMGGTTGSQAKQTGYTITGLIEFKLWFRVQSLDVWYLEFMDLISINLKQSNYLTKDISKNDLNAAGSFSDISFKPSGKLSTAINSNIRGAYGYSYGCSATPAVFWTAPGASETEKIAVGIVLNNFQVEAYNTYFNNGSNPDDSNPRMVQFKFNKVYDCVPTFTVGSWMSIITSLVMAAVFIFGFFMLNSIQTMDRFDDPKAKQIVINTKE